MLPVAMDVNHGGLGKTPRKQAQRESPTLSREMVAPACVSEDLGGVGEETRGSTRRQEEGRVNGGVHPEARGDADDTDEINGEGGDGGGTGHGADSASEEVTSARGDVESSAVSTGPRSSSAAVASPIRLPPLQSSATAESASRPSSDIAALLSTPTPVSTSSALPPSSTPPHPSTPPIPSSSPSSSSPPQPSTSPLSSPPPPPRSSTPPTLSSSPSPSPSSSPSSPSAAAETRGPVSTAAVSAFSDDDSDDDDFGEFKAAPSHTAALGWLEARGGSPHSRGVVEWLPGTVGGPARELARSRGSDAASRGAVKVLVSGSRDDAAAAAVALRRALEECFSPEPPAATTTTGRCAEQGDADSRPAADETVTPLTRHLLGETPAGDRVADNGPLPRSVWPKLRTVEDGETWRLPWAASHACRQLRRALGAARARTPLSADEEERIPGCPEEGEETAARPTKPWDLAVKKETMQEPVIHTRVTAGRYRPRSADGVVTLARAPVRTVFGFVRPGPS